MPAIHAADMPTRASWDFGTKRVVHLDLNLLRQQNLRHDERIGMADSATLICTATEFEANLLRERLADDSGFRFVQMGIGVVNAAHAVTLAIIADKPRAIVV